MRKINYYISSHGFGHSTRAIEVINHLPADVDVEIITNAPQWLFDYSIVRSFAFRLLDHDPGIMQLDSLRNDVERTYDSWAALLEQYPAMAEREAQRMAEEDVGLAVGDISPFAIAAAELAGIPSIIVANFSWDWIFSAFLEQKPAFKDIIDRVASYYRRAGLLLRTPLAGDLSVFPRIEDTPLIVRQSNKTREEARKLFGLKPDDKVVLISFGGMGLDSIKKDHLAPFHDIVFLTFDRNLLGPANVRYLPPRDTYHPDAIQASDIALAKLGYGIVTECIAHRTPIAYPPRLGFLEHPVLAKEASRWIPALPIEEDAFYSGQWDFLSEFFLDDAKREKSANSYPRLDGGASSARRLHEWLSDSRSQL